MMFFRDFIIKRFTDKFIYNKIFLYNICIIT